MIMFSLLESGRSSCVQSERVRYYHRIQEILAEDLPMIFLYNRDSLPVVDGVPAGSGHPGPQRCRLAAAAAR